ncbi:MAG: M23 family metallopeptidase [Chthoniobacterales bacterium]
MREGAEQSWFAASVRVHVGDQVRAGDAIGKLGSSGNSTEPHLLFASATSLIH